MSLEKKNSNRITQIQKQREKSKKRQIARTINARIWNNYRTNKLSSRCD